MLAAHLEVPERGNVMLAVEKLWYMFRCDEPIPFSHATTARLLH